MVVGGREWQRVADSGSPWQGRVCENKVIAQSKTIARQCEGKALADGVANTRSCISDHRHVSFLRRALDRITLSCMRSLPTRLADG